MSKLLFLGDFFYDYSTDQDDINKIASWIQEGDYKVILNLETSLVKTADPIKKRGPNICSSPITVDILKKLNVICVCLANNHFMDFGALGAEQSLRLLDENNIKHVGAGKNLSEAVLPLTIEVDGKPIIIQNYGWDVEETRYATKKDYGCSPLNREVVLKNTQDIRNNSQGFIVNIYHWGFEFNELPMPYDIKFAHDSVDMGADLIIGHHPHVIQPKESYKNKNIYYSLGNFYFSSMREEYFKSLYGEQCDLGIGVVWDLEDHSTKEIGVLFNRAGHSSEIIDCPIVEDISGIDFSSADYYKDVAKRAGKPNPILTLSEKENRKKLKKLSFKYAVAAKLTFLKKSKVGSKIYNLMKKTQKA